MKVAQEITEALDGAAEIAASFQRKVSIFVVLGLAASAGLAWVVCSPESSLTWNIIKCGLVLLPVMVIGVVWKILNQFAEAPDIVSKLAYEEDGLVQNLQTMKLNKPTGVRGLISTVRTLRDTEELSEIVEVVGAIAFLANPLFIIVSFISMILLCLLILIAPFVLIF